MIKNTFEEQILMGRLPSSPGVGRLLVQLVRRKGLELDEITKVVRIDPALTGGLLQAARPLAPSGSGPIETVEAAIQVLGPGALLRSLRDLTLVASGGSRWCAGFDYSRYWAISLARAIAAETIMRATGRPDAEAAYTLGLLADIGRLALASVYPTEYAALLVEPRARESAELSRLERGRLQIDHAEVSACLFERWGMRRLFTRAVLLYEKDGESTETEEAQSLDLAEVLRCAQLQAEIHVDALDREPNGGTTLAVSSLRVGLNLSDEAARMVAAEVHRQLIERAKVPEATAPQKPELQVEAPEAVPTRTLESVARHWDGLRILVVDDDPTSLEILRRTLAQAGHQVQCASDGVEALQIALESNPQAIVADWMMPRMDGVELCKALRCIQMGREMYFLLVTGRDQEDQIVAAYDAGVDEYVTKPFNSRILLARLKAGQRVMELRNEVDAERLVTAQHVRDLGIANRKLNVAALTDPLTGLANRRCARNKLSEEWQNSMRSSSPLSVMMVDIDRFKRVNDEYGHEIGDLVLNEVAQILKTHTRQGEEVARLGGEEFLVICPNTSAEQAYIGAQRLRAAVESHVIRTPRFHTSTTVSLGVAGRTSDMSGIDALLKAADEAVYIAKSAGRNQVKRADTSGGGLISA
jgi:two-component system cell cycle response regulator